MINKDKKVSITVNHMTYQILKIQAGLDDRSVRSYFDKFIKDSFRKDYDKLTNQNTNPTITKAPSLHPEWDED